MQLNFTVDTNDFDCYECGNGANDFVEAILNKAATQVLTLYTENDVYDWDELIDEKMEEIVHRAQERFEEGLYDKIKLDVAAQCVEKLTTKMEDKVVKSKAYRGICESLDVESDSAIKAGMKALIAETVREEVKKLIRV